MVKKKSNKPGAIPPQWADRFLRWYCSSELLDEIQGDLYEVFYLRVEKYGPWKARLLFVKEVIQFCRPSSFNKSTPTNHLSNMPGLFQNYLNITVRNTLKNKVFSMVNIVGLAIGLAACFLIMQYVLFERSYDKFHNNSDRIYRVNLSYSAGRTSIATNQPGVGPTLKTDFPEVEEYVRVLPQAIFMGDISAWSYVDEQGNAKVFNEERVYNVDPSFFTMFSFPLIYGDPQGALEDASSVVISKTVAKKYFGTEDPMGKTLQINWQKSVVVTGVFEDVPENSHFKFDILVSFFTRDGDGNRHLGWRWPEFYTYIRLAPSADPQQVSAKLPGFVARYLADVIKEYKWDIAFKLQPITDIHLKSPNVGKEIEAQGNERIVYFLTLIALLILIIAWINYINLSTSRSIERAQEVGLRKVAGASKRQLIIQFLLESAMVNFLAILLSLALIVVAFPYFTQLIGKRISASVWELFQIKEPLFWLALSGVFVLGSFFAGLYPAFVLSSFKVATVLKGKFSRSKSGIVLRKSLVGLQFVISVSLIAGTIMVFKQVSFMRNQELGYAKDQLLIVKSPHVADSTFQDKLMTFRTELKRNSDINNVAPSSEIPGKSIAQLNLIRKNGEDVDTGKLAYQFYIDRDFIDTYEFDLAAGRNFREHETLNFQEKGMDPIPIILNQKLIESLGYTDAKEAINQLVKFKLVDRDRQGEIVGVVANHHQRSLKDDYDPIMFFPVPGYGGQFLSINMSMSNPPETISFIEKQYRQSFPGNQFEYFFLDDYFDHQYRADQQFGKVFGSFSSLALIVACLGLFGLSTFMISQRTKEIAIRKVLGATISGMIYLFSKDFVKLIVAANVIALPLVYLAIKKWLNNFAFPVDIGWIVFMLPTIILLVVSLVTISIQAIKSGSMNPINSLRKE